MADRRIDRAAWARVAGELVANEPRHNKSAIARRLGITTKTIDRWLQREVDVSEESIRTVAVDLGRSPIQLLIDVGYYRRDEVTAPPAANDDDEEMRLILTANVDDDTKRRMIDRLFELRERDKRRRMEEVQWALGQQAKEA